MKIICIGRNYSDHAKEMNASIPSEPMFFMKPDTALLKEGNDFYYPNHTKDLHYECELVVKIKKAGKSIAKEFAQTYYDEISLGIDFTARDLQEKCKKNGHPWEIAKAFDNSAPISNTFLPISNFNLKSLHFSFHKNGQLVQKGNSADMIFDIDTLISYVSGIVSLKQGDLIYTGTPAGVGPVQIGDKLEGFIEDEKMFEFVVK